MSRLQTIHDRFAHFKGSVNKKNQKTPRARRSIAVLIYNIRCLQTVAKTAKQWNSDALILSATFTESICLQKDLRFTMLLKSLLSCYVSSSRVWLLTSNFSVFSQFELCQSEQQDSMDPIGLIQKSHTSLQLAFFNF